MRIKHTFILTILFLVLFALPVKAEERSIHLYYFHAEGCSTCALETAYLDELVKEDTNLVLHSYELAFNEENQKLARDIGTLLGQEIQLTPTLIVGREVIVGFSVGSTESRIEEAIDFVRTNNVRDVVGEMLGFVKPKEGVDLVNQDTTIKLPFLGEIDAKTVCLPILAIVLGTLDGFNPCAMWVLLLLISMLFHLEEQWKKWFLGGLFLTTTAVMYFLG